MLKSLAVAAILSVAAVPAHASLLAYDSFDTDAASTTLNIAALLHWTVGGGTVDYLHNGGYGIQCFGGAGGCIDTDGSTKNAGRIDSTEQVEFVVGTEYKLTFYYSGNQRNADFDTLIFGYGDTLFGEVSAAGNAGFVLHERVFTAGATGLAGLYFQGVGGDNIGLILDEIGLHPYSSDPDKVVVANVPEPASLALVGLGLIALGAALGRCRR